MARRGLGSGRPGESAVWLTALGRGALRVLARARGSSYRGFLQTSHNFLISYFFTYLYFLYLWKTCSSLARLAGLYSKCLFLKLAKVDKQKNDVFCEKPEQLFVCIFSLAYWTNGYILITFSTFLYSILSSILTITHTCVSFLS
jgi:hypothetical protein